MPSRKPQPSTLPSPSPTTLRAPLNAVGADLYSLDVEITVGMPETGKSSGVKAGVAYESRLIVWDPNDEWRTQRCQRVTSFGDLKAAMLAAGAGAARLAYVPEDFDFFQAFCALARGWAEPNRADRGPCVVVVEELGDVSAQGRAPRLWGQLTRAGRHRGLKIRAVGHSPKEIDKTILRSASTWRVHKLGDNDDCLYMSERFLYIDPEKLVRLQPYEYIEVRNKYPREAVLKKTSPI